MKKLVFTNGYFGVIHLIHVRLLEFCGMHREVVVGINSDASIRRIKVEFGPSNLMKARLKAISLKGIELQMDLKRTSGPKRVIKFD